MKRVGWKKEQNHFPNITPPPPPPPPPCLNMLNKEFNCLLSELCPTCAAYYSNRAATHIMMNHFKQALVDARTSLRIDPNFAKVSQTRFRSSHHRHHHHHHHWAAVVSRGWAKASACYPVLCCPLPDRVTPVFVQVVSPLLGWSLLSSFLVIWTKWWHARSIDRLWGGRCAPKETIIRGLMSTNIFYLWTASIFYFSVETMAKLWPTNADFEQD